MPGDLHLVVGLGNPGPEYKRSRHNLGFRVADLLAERFRVRMRASKFQAIVADVFDDDVRMIIAKPTTYMNLSGNAVRALMRFFKVPLERLVIVHDELDLPLGVVQVKLGGGTAGNNGLESIVQSLASKDFARVRIGIGRPPGRQSGADYVLGAIRKREEDELGPAVERAAGAVVTIVEEGVAAAQNRFNVRA